MSWPNLVRSLVVFVVLTRVNLVNSSRQELEELLDGLDDFSRCDDIERQDFVDYFSYLLIQEIQLKARSVRLEDEYQRVRFGVQYGMMNKATISLHSGVTSKPTMQLVNVTVNDFSSNHIDFNSRVLFDDIRLSYFECKLNISGTTQHGSISANVSNFQGVISTRLAFQENGWRQVRHLREVLGRATTNPNVELGLRRNSTNLFVIYANMVEGKDLEEIFRRQIVKVYNVLIWNAVDSIYQSLKTTP